MQGGTTPITSPTHPPMAASPLTSPIAVQRRPKSIHRGSMGAMSPQGAAPVWPSASPMSSPGQGSSPFMSPTSPQQSRGFDARRTQSRHGKVTFDLSEEDLHFLSQQGKKQDAMLRSDSSSSSLTSSPESKVKKDDSAAKLPPVSKSSQPAKRDFPHLLLSSAKSGDANAVGSPRSPRQQPRWEDLAGLNQDFRAMAGLDRGNSVESIEQEESPPNRRGGDFVQRGRSSSDSCVKEDNSFERKLQDLSDFNEIWRRQLAPTGEVCRIGDRSNSGNVQTGNKEEQVTSQRHQLRKSSTIAAMEMAREYNHPSRERTPECSMEERTLVLEKPMIKKCLTESDIPQIKHCSIMTQDSTSTTSSSGTSDVHSGGQDISQSMARNSDQNVANIRHEGSSCSGANSDNSAIPNKIQKTETKDFKLDMPMLPPLELSGFPQFENSGLTPTTGASLGKQKGNEDTSKRDSDVTIYENDPLPQDLDIRDFGTVGQQPNASGSYGNEQEVTLLQQSQPPQQSMMDDFDLNESCFGIPSHQNLTNEMREKAQERLKASQIGDTSGSVNLQVIITVVMNTHCQRDFF